MKKFLLAFICLVVMGQGLMGMKNSNNNSKDSKQEELKALYQTALKNGSYEGKTVNKNTSLEDFIKIRDQVLEEEHQQWLKEDEEARAVIGKKSENLIKTYSDYQNKKDTRNSSSTINKDRPPVTHYDSEFVRMQFAEDAKDLIKKDIAQKNGFENYNQYVGNEQAEQQYYAQKRLVELQRKDEGSYPHRFLKLTGKHIENRAAQAIAELVVDVPLSLGLQQLKMWWYADTIKKNQLHQEYAEKEKALVKSTKNTAAAFTQQNKRAIEQYNELKQFVSHIDQKAFEKDFIALQQEIEQVANKQGVGAYSRDKNEDPQEIIENKIAQLLKKYDMTQQDFVLFQLNKKIQNDLPENIQKELMYNAAWLGINEQQLQEAQQEFMTVAKKLKEEQKKAKK